MHEDFSNEFATLLLQILNGQVISPEPLGWIIKLYTTIFNNGSAQELNTSLAPGYAPVILSGPNNLGFKFASDLAIKNDTPIVFPANTGNSNWPTVVAVSLGKNPQGNSDLPEIIVYGKLDNGCSISPGDRLRFPENRFVISFVRDSNNFISSVLAHHILNFFAGIPIQAPNNFYLGVGSKIPTSDGKIEEIIDLPRLSIPCTQNSWIPAGTRTMTNNIVLEFPPAPRNLPKITSFGLFDSPRAAGQNSNDIPWFFGVVQTPKQLSFEDILFVPTSGLTISL